MSESSTGRNQQILEVLAVDKTPILPFEVDVAEGEFEKHKREQVMLSAKLGEAMNQSSETWHDNAPAEAITADSKVLAERAKKTIGVLQNSVVFEYPTPDEEEVTLGSLVTYRYKGDKDDSKLYITGSTRTVGSDIEDRLPTDDQELDFATLSSPLVMAMLGKTAGKDVHFIPNGRRPVDLTIVSVDQIQM